MAPLSRWVVLTVSGLSEGVDFDILYDGGLLASKCVVANKEKKKKKSDAAYFPIAQNNTMAHFTSHKNVTIFSSRLTPRQFSQFHERRVFPPHPPPSSLPLPSFHSFFLSFTLQPLIFPYQKIKNKK